MRTPHAIKLDSGQFRYEFFDHSALRPPLVDAHGFCVNIRGDFARRAAKDSSHNFDFFPILARLWRSVCHPIVFVIPSARALG